MRNLCATKRRLQGWSIGGFALLVTLFTHVAGIADDGKQQFGNESNGLQIRLISLSPNVTDETPALQKIASSYKRSHEMTFAVQLKNVSREPISLAGIRYGDGFSPETRGKLNMAMLAPHWFEFEFTDMDGKRILRTPHREFYQGLYHADSASVHVLAPGESLIEVLRPNKFMEPMDYELLPGKYRVQVHYRGPDDSLREYVCKHWPDKPILNAWPHHATSNVSDFSIEETSNRTKPEELIWGKPVEGLQAAFEYRLPEDAKGNPLIAPGVSTGSHLGITFHLRNVSDKPITFVSETGRQGDAINVADESGREVEVPNIYRTGEPIDVAWKLMPGEIAQLRLLTSGLGSLDKPGKYKVRYTVRFKSRIQKDDAGKIIFPRPGDYDKEVDTGETPLFLHESKKEISANGGKAQAVPIFEVPIGISDVKDNDDNGERQEPVPHIGTESHLTLRHVELNGERLIELARGKNKQTAYPFTVQTDAGRIEVTPSAAGRMRIVRDKLEMFAGELTLVSSPEHLQISASVN